MTEQTAALSFGRVLDGERGIDLNGSESLLTTARSVQTLFDHQHGIPSEEFVMQLEQTLFAPAVVPSEAEGPPAAAVSRPQPRPVPVWRRDDRTSTLHRWIALAAVLALVLGGSGAFVFGPWRTDSTPEPSAIPAAMLGTVEASPAPEVANWTVAPPEGSTRLITPGLVSNGRVFSVFAADDENTVVQAVDLQNGQVLWSGPLGSWRNLLAATAGDLLLATATEENGSTLTAYDGDTGGVRWQIELEQRPVGLLVQDDRIVVLGSGNGLDAFDLNSQQSLWQADLSQYDEAAADDAGMNKYFNMTGSRLAATDGVVGAIVSNGRLVGVDAGDGTVRWANERTTNAATIVMVVDGKFVVTAPGSDIQGYDYGGAAGTPIPETNRCQAAMAPRTGTAPGAIRPNGAGADSFDPATGESPWGIETNRPAWIWRLDDSNLVAVVSPGWDIVHDRPQDLFPCKIDGATGAISDLDGNSLVDVVLDINSATPTGMAGFPDGGSFVIPDIDPAVAASLPLIESNGSHSAGASWVQTVDGLILVSLSDGTLMAMPARTSDTTAIEATPATPVDVTANAGWVVPGPAGEHAESEDFGPVVDSGRIFRSFYDVTAANHTQAVDMATGDVLWDVSLDVRGEVMASSGDVLLVGGRVGGLLKESALVALDQATGKEVWRVTLSDFPAAIAVDGDRAFVLGANNQLDAIELTSGTSIYASDIGGELEPHASFPILGSQYRLAIDGDLLVAVLADGTMAGVDIESGAGIWWNLLSWSSGVRVAYLDGALVVAEYGDTSDDLAEGDLTGTPEPATPTASGTPIPASCLDSFSPASPVANSNVDESPMLGVRYLRIDPDTGRILWSVESMVPVYGQFVDDVGVVYLATTPVDWPTDPSQVALCAIDPSTGQSFEIDQLSDLGASPFLMTMTSDGVQRETVGVEFGDGEMFGGPAMIDPTVTGPKVTIDLDASGGTRWLGIYDDAIYLSRLDGSLERIPIPAR